MWGLFMTPWIVSCTKFLCPWDFQGKSTGVGCYFLLQGIFPTQGWNPGLSHCRQTLYHLNHQGRHEIGKISKTLALTASNWLRNHNPIKHIFQWGRGFQLIFYTLCFSNSAGFFFSPLLLMSKTELKLEQGLKIQLFAGERHIT